NRYPPRRPPGAPSRSSRGPEGWPGNGDAGLPVTTEHPRPAPAGAAPPVPPRRTPPGNKSPDDPAAPPAPYGVRPRRDRTRRHGACSPGTADVPPAPPPAYEGSPPAGRLSAMATGRSPPEEKAHQS